jgi:hypothetical protein
MEVAIYCVSELDQLQGHYQAHSPQPHSAPSPSQIVPDPVVI